MGWGGITLMRGAAYIRGPVAQGTAVSTKREGAWGARPKGAGQDHRSPHPLPCCGTGRKAALPSQGQLERNAAFSSFQLPFPHQQPSAFLRPGVRMTTGERRDCWPELHWWLGG